MSFQRRWLVALAVSCALVLPYSWYRMQKPRLVAQRAMQQVLSAEVGRTTLEQFDAITAQDPIQSAIRQCDGGKCFYTVSVDNGLLRRLHLAPPMRTHIGVEFEDGIVSHVYLFSSMGNQGETAQVFVDQFGYAPPGCPSPSCISTKRQSDGTPLRVQIMMGPGTPPEKRQRAFSFDARCLSKIGGCNASELLPQVWEVEERSQENKP